MERGTLAPLSPNEEGTLRRIATAVSPRAMLRARDVERLLKLLLVRDIDGRLDLTAIGRERYRQISGTLGPASSPDAINAAVVNLFGEPC